LINGGVDDDLVRSSLQEEKLRKSLPLSLTKKKNIFTPTTTGNMMGGLDDDIVGGLDDDIVGGESNVVQEDEEETNTSGLDASVHETTKAQPSDVLALDTTTKPPYNTMPSSNTLFTAEDILTDKERAARYREIMSPSFPRGARVFIKFGVAAYERWFPGTVMGGSYREGYKVEYDDGDMTDQSANCKAQESICLMTLETEDLACLSLGASSSGEDDDFVDGSVAVNKKKRTNQRENTTSHEEFASHIKTKQATVEIFPARHGQNGKSLPRVKTGTAVVKADSKTGSQFVGIVRQILRDPKDGSFTYIIRSPRLVHPVYHEEVGEEKFGAEALLGKRWATKEPFVSQSSGAKDVFLSPTQCQESQSFSPTVSRYLAPGENRGSALASFRLRYASKGFRADQSRVLEELEVAVNKYIVSLPSDVCQSLRVDWKNWGVVDKLGDNYVFQLVALLVHTNASRDYQLHCSMQEVFLHRSVVTGTCFKDPYTFALDPQGGYNFLTARAVGASSRFLHSNKGKGNKEDGDEHDNNGKGNKEDGDEHGNEEEDGDGKDDDDTITDDDDDTITEDDDTITDVEDEEAIEDGNTGKGGGISKGFNFCNAKARHLVFLSKQLIAFKYKSLSGHDCSNQSWYNPKSMAPMPTDYVKLVQEAAARADSFSRLFLFPRRYDRRFLDSLMGIGPKIRNLIAEAAYKVAGGPAVDCHMIRYVVSFGSGSSLLVSSTEALAKDLSRCYPPRLWPTLNEVPATISQIIWSPKCEHVQFLANLKQVAEKFGYADELTAFLSHYA
jgi:endonuclease III